MTTAEQAASSAATQYAVRTERAATAAVSSGERAATAAVSSHQCYITASATSPPVLQHHQCFGGSWPTLRKGCSWREWMCVCVCGICVCGVCVRERRGGCTSVIDCVEEEDLELRPNHPAVAPKGRHRPHSRLALVTPHDRNQPVDWGGGPSPEHAVEQDGGGQGG